MSAASAPSSDTPAAQSRAVLRIAGFLPLLFGRTVSMLGREMLAVAVGWELYERTGSFVVLGLVGLAQVAPVVLLAVPAGVVVDRFDARVVAALSTLGLGAAAAGLAAASVLHAPVAVYYALLVLHGTALAFHSPAVSAIFPRMMHGLLRARANAIVSSAFEIAVISGAAAAGFVLALTSSAAVVYSIQLVVSVAFGGVLLMLRVRGIAAAEAGHTPLQRSWADMLAGLRFVFASPVLLAAFSLDLFAVMFGGVAALFPVFAKDVLHGGPLALGMLRAAPALGAAAMALLSTRLPPWRRPGRTVLIAVGVFACATIGFALSRSLPLSVALLFVVGAADNINVVIRVTLEQMLVPDAMRGRVSAIRYVFIGMSNELGELESGLAAAWLGAVPSVIAGATVSLGVVAFVAWRSAALRALPPLAELRPVQE